MYNQALIAHATDFYRIYGRLFSTAETAKKGRDVVSPRRVYNEKVMYY